MLAIGITIELNLSQGVCGAWYLKKKSFRLSSRYNFDREIEWRLMQGDNQATHGIKMMVNC